MVTGDWWVVIDRERKEPEQCVAPPPPNDMDGSRPCPADLEPSPEESEGRGDARVARRSSASQSQLASPSSLRLERSRTFLP